MIEMSQGSIPPPPGDRVVVAPVVVVEGAGVLSGITSNCAQDRDTISCECFLVFYFFYSHYTFLELFGNDHMSTLRVYAN